MKKKRDLESILESIVEELRHHTREKRHEAHEFELPRVFLPIYSYWSPGVNQQQPPTSTKLPPTCPYCRGTNLHPINTTIRACLSCGTIFVAAENLERFRAFAKAKNLNALEEPKLSLESEDKSANK